ncbi:hypothetical protein [Streptomyces canus]|uniref:hypothetical protein n=1 Tax=Streptomyces canus TaxID=58343 RepID=UPI0033BAAC0E
MLADQIRNFARGGTNLAVCNDTIARHEIVIRTSTSKPALAEVIGKIQRQGFPVVANIFVMPHVSDGLVRVHLIQPGNCRIGKISDADREIAEEAREIDYSLHSALLKTDTLRTPENWMQVERLPRSDTGVFDWSAWTRGLFGIALEEVSWASPGYLIALDSVWRASSLAGLQEWAIARLLATAKRPRSISAALDAVRSPAMLAKAVRIISPRAYDAVALCGAVYSEMTLSVARRVQQGLRHVIRDSEELGQTRSHTQSKVDQVRFRYSSVLQAPDLSMTPTVIEALQHETGWTYSDALRCIEGRDYPRQCAQADSAGTTCPVRTW